MHGKMQIKGILAGSIFYDIENTSLCQAELNRNNIVYINCSSANSIWMFLECKHTLFWKTRERERERELGP